MALVPPYIAALKPYKPGRTIAEVQRTFGVKRVAGLASNENPLGPSPRALEAIRAHLSDLHHYPNSGLDLRARLAEEYGTKIENVIAGSGSDSIMSDLIRTF